MVLSEEFYQQKDSNLHKYNHRNNITAGNPLTTNDTSITVEIDMQQKIAKFENNENKDAVLELKNLPESVAIAFSFGHYVQKVSCTHQQFC